MAQLGEEKRKYERYDTEVKIYFHVNYDIKTRVKFQVVDKNEDRVSPKKYSALSKNISVEGLCFTSEKRLNAGDTLFLEVYLPGEKDRKIIPMEGEVRWSNAISEKNKNKFETGVKLVAVDGKPVSPSIYFDQANQITWSIVLDSIFGNFKKFVEKKLNPLKP